jgi:hypothetical protein
MGEETLSSNQLRAAERKWRIMRLAGIANLLIVLSGFYLATVLWRAGSIGRIFALGVAVGGIRLMQKLEQQTKAAFVTLHMLRGMTYAEASQLWRRK